MLLLLAQTPPSFDTLINSDPFRLLFATLIFTIIILVIIVFRLSNGLSKATDRFNATLDNFNKTQDDLEDDAQTEFLTTKTQLEHVLGRLKRLERRNKDSMQAMGEMLVESANLHAETRQALTEQLANLIANAAEQILFQRGAALLTNVFRFPPPSDCRWKMAVIKWRWPDKAARIFKAPLYNFDGNEIGQVKGNGEVVQIITDTLIPGWGAIIQSFGENPISGFVDLSFISIEPLPSDKESAK